MGVTHWHERKWLLEVPQVNLKAGTAQGFGPGLPERTGDSLQRQVALFIRERGEAQWNVMWQLPLRKEATVSPEWEHET